MYISELSVKRPVLATVVTLLLIIFGYVSFLRLSLREYPDINPPIVSVEVTYPGASANVIESKITEKIEDRIAGIEGIKFIESKSEDGKSTVNIEFSIERDIDGAANDIRDRVSSIIDDLPSEADPPEIQKVDANDDVIIWLNLQSKNMTVPELTDYAERYLVDRFSVLDGVARIRVGGGQSYAMRIWLDRKALTKRNISILDIETALRNENVELPAGSVESVQSQFTVRVKRSFSKVKDFEDLAIKKVGNYTIRLKDVARVELGTTENRIVFKGNGVPMVGIGTVKQSTANTIKVARSVKEMAEILNADLPEGISLETSYDTSIFVEEAINEVFSTLAISIILVILVIYLFIADVKAMLIPAVTVPVSLVSTFIVLYLMGYSLNLLTLLGLVLAIGMVVDDSIVVLENISRRIKELDEHPLLAAIRGTKEVGFAVIATTLVLIAVFVPLSFLEGDLGRLFSEFAITMTAAVCFSSFIALTLCPMLASKLLTKKNANKSAKTYYFILKLKDIYSRYLNLILSYSKVITFFALVLIGLSFFLFKSLPFEYTPKEDRGAFFIIVNGPEGASYNYIEDYMLEIEKRLMPYVEKKEIQRLLIRAPRNFGGVQSFNTGIVICLLNSWSERRNAFLIMDEVRNKLSDLSGVRAFPIMRQGFSNSFSKPVQFVIGGAEYDELAKWRDILLEAVSNKNPGLIGLDYDYKETKPQIQVNVNYLKASELGVNVREIASTLETLLGSKRVTTFIKEGEEYDVIIEGERKLQSSISDLADIYVRSDLSNKLIPLENLVNFNEFADSPILNRFNRVRAITLEANLSDTFALGNALDYLKNLVKEKLPTNAIIDYKGQSRDLIYSGSSISFIFILGILITFLVLAAQFESFIHPFVIILTVPTAIFGALTGLYAFGGSLNLYTQIGLIMLVGLSAKNGILIVEFANQLRAKGVEFNEAIIEASKTRLRPILMTGITTVAGSIPLLISSGAGSETRQAIGIVVLFGVLTATFLTLILIPGAYFLFAKNTKNIDSVQKEIDQLT